MSSSSSLSSKDSLNSEVTTPEKTREDNFDELFFIPIVRQSLSHSVALSRISVRKNRTLLEKTREIIQETESVKTHVAEKPLINHCVTENPSKETENPNIEFAVESNESFDADQQFQSLKEKKSLEPNNDKIPEKDSSKIDKKFLGIVPRNEISSTVETGKPTDKCSSSTFSMLPKAKDFSEVVLQRMKCSNRRSTIGGIELPVSEKNPNETNQKPLLWRDLLKKRDEQKKEKALLEIPENSVEKVVESPNEIQKRNTNGRVSNLIKMFDK